MKIRYRREASRGGNARDYQVRTQEAPRGRWVYRGIVSGFGSGPTDWAALGDGAAAWTAYRPTRSAAVADMLAGRTFKDSEGTS